MRKQPAPTAAAKKHAAPKGTEPEGPPPDEAPARPLWEAMLDEVSPEHDGEDPDTSASALSNHARTLANTVDTEREVLNATKLAPDASPSLRTRADTLDAADLAWLNARAHTVRRSDVNKIRPDALRGHRDLSSGLRLYAKADAATQFELDEVGTADDDDDLGKDLRRLVNLGRKHKSDLEGTDVPPARVEEIAALSAEFDAARSGALMAANEGSTDNGGAPGAPGAPGAKPGTFQALTKEARGLLALRNRAFWHLVALVREVNEHGKHAHRHNPEGQKLYSSYNKRERPAKKPPVK